MKAIYNMDEAAKDDFREALIFLLYIQRLLWILK